MARNADATRRRILSAATEEFAAHGLAGARIDRIAEAAQANKRMIYEYYGSKAELFTTVIEVAVQEAHDAVPFTEGDLPGYAAALFDYVIAEPALARLEGWRRLEGLLPGENERAMYRRKVESLSADRVETAADTLMWVMGIAGAWFTAPEALRVLTTQDLDHQRQLVIDTVAAIAERTAAPST